MSFFDTQNPGIGGIDELTPEEEVFLMNLVGLSYEEGDVLSIVSGNPQWIEPTGGSTGLSHPQILARTLGA